MGCLVLLKMFFVMFAVLHTIEPCATWTRRAETAGNEKKNLRDQTETSRRDAEAVCELSEPPKISPGGCLFEVSIGVKFEGGNFKEFEGIEKRVARSIETLKLLLQCVWRIDAPGLLFIYWLYFHPSTEDIYLPLQTRINLLLRKKVANLRLGKAILFSTLVEDVDECSSGLSVCDPEANCFNAFGFYFCQCTEGFEDRFPNASGTSCVESVKSESGLGTSLGFHDILAAIILCVVLILAIILILLFVMKVGLFSGIMIPVCGCHMTIKGGSGEFISPVYPNTYLECNWTISAVPLGWIELQIDGFVSQEDYNQNPEAIIIQESAHMISHVLQACLNKTPHDASVPYIMFFSQGNSNNSTTHFYVKYQVNEDSKTPSVPILPACKIFPHLPTASVNTEAAANEKLHQPPSKNRLHSEAAESIPQGYMREQRDADTRVFTQLIAGNRSRERSAAGSEEDLSASKHTVQIPAKAHVSSFADIRLWNILFPQPFTSSSEPAGFTAVQFAKPLRPLVPPSDFPEYLPLKSNTDPQMSLITPERLKPQTEDYQDIPEPSRFKINLVTCRFDELDTISDTSCQWHIPSSTCGFWFSVTSFQQQETPIPHSSQTDLLPKQQIENYSNHRVRQSSDFSHVVESYSPIIFQPVAPIESEQMEDGRSSAPSDRSGGIMTGLFDSTWERGGTQSSSSISSENVLFSLITICDTVGDFQCEDLEHTKTQPLKTSLQHGYTQSKIKSQILNELGGPMLSANDEMIESALIHSDSSDGMLTLLPTPSLNSYLWMKTKSQNSYTAEDFIQTSSYQSRETELHKSLIYGEEQQIQSEWMLMSFSPSPSLDTAQHNVDATIIPTDGSFRNAEYPMEPSTGSQNLTRTTLGPKLQNDIGHLLEVSAAVELVNVVYKNFLHLEKRVLQSVKALIMDNLASFSPPLKKILLGGAKRINSSGLTFDYQLYFGLNGENIYRSLQIQMNKLLNKSVTNLRAGKIYLVSISVRDVDECKSEIGACAKAAKCLNTIGSYFCQCENGFKDPAMTNSRVCVDPVEPVTLKNAEKPVDLEIFLLPDSGFWSSFGLQEILISSAICAFLLIAVTVTVCFVMFKRSHKKYFQAYGTNAGGLSVTTLSEGEEESGSEELLFLVPHKSSSYVSFTKFQPIPEEPNGQIDSRAMSKSRAVKIQPAVETFHL
ncbi:uncharacterized protein LOC144504762 [Mustelus asterias]